MPDPRPLSSLRTGAYDEPAASSESATNWSGTRSRLRRPLPSANEAVYYQLQRGEVPNRAILDMASLELRGRGLTGLLRRRRSISSDVEQDSTAEVDVGRRRRHKRRRLDHSPPPLPRQPIKYGYYGQVEPGRLKMELVSCDGGEHKDPRSPEDLGAENILRHDKSVYCSERRCINIILRHADDTPFCLEKLHIVGPEHGFTAPVREGMVTVAMTMSDLQPCIEESAPSRARTPREHDTASPVRWTRRSIRSSPERLTLADALRDPEVNAALAVVEESNHARYADAMNHPSTTAAADPTLTGYYGNDFGFGRTDPEAHCEIPTPAEAVTLGNTTPTNEHNRPVTFLSDEDPGQEDTSSPGWLDYRLQRLRMMRRRFETENWDREDRWAGLNRLPPDATERDRESGNWNLNRLDALMARSRVRDDSTTPPPPRRGTPPPHARRARAEEISIPAPIPPPDSSSPAPVQEAHVIHHHPNAQRARFTIKRGKFKVAMQFQPALSGRFVLLQLWSYKSNVDVQSVILKGYGGGRFFPASDVK